MWNHHFNLRADGGSAAARARTEAEPESPMGAAISPPLWGQNVGELLAKCSEGIGCIRKAVRLNGVRLNEDVERAVRKQLRNLLVGSSGIHVDGAPDVPVGHLASCQRINAGEGVDIVHHAVALDRAGAVIGHGELLIVQRRRGVHAAVENGSVQSSRDHDTDADVSGVLASVDDVGHLVVRLTRIEHHVVALILSRVGFDLVIGVERIAGFVLAGIAIHSVAQTILMFLKLAADPEKQLASIEYWIMGSLNGVSKDSLAIPFFVTCAGFIIMTLLYRQILILSINEDEAAALGVNVTVLRFIILMIATLIVSSIICVTGLISFIGLIAPHIARLLTRRNDRYTYISSGLAGAIIMTLADIFARSVSSSELPVSIFTSLLGAPLLIILLIKANKKEVA